MAALAAFLASILGSAVPVLAPVTQDAAPVAQVTTATDTVRVNRVIDGDTVVLADGRTVRYIGIDAPETGATAGIARECWADEATAANRALVEGREVRLEKDTSDTDRYGRLLRYVWIGDTMVNHELVVQGVATAKRYKPDTARAADLEAAQAEAKAATRGMWSMCSL